MGHTRLLADIEAVKEAIGVADSELQALVADLDHRSSVQEAEANEVIAVASSKLSVARAKLVELEELLELAKLDAARAAIDEAEIHLDRVLGEIVVVPGAEKTCATKVVRDAFSRLSAAKVILAELKSHETDQD